MAGFVARCDWVLVICVYRKYRPRACASALSLNCNPGAMRSFANMISMCWPFIHGLDNTALENSCEISENSFGDGK